MIKRIAALALILSALQNVCVQAHRPDLSANVGDVLFTSEGQTDADMYDIPEYSGEPYVFLNGGKTHFDQTDITTEPFEWYCEKDSMGRCGIAYANICEELMPTEDRENIGSIHPSGWQSVKYDDVPGGYLYNRCHLIGFQLAGENANDKNLITGTRYLNIEGMLPFETEVADYVEETGNHVLYRITPLYEGENAVADGVIMEAMSVEDNGNGVCFNVFCYNVQPGIHIDYDTGRSRKKGRYNSDYFVNRDTMIFHIPDCAEVGTGEQPDGGWAIGTRDDMIDGGYTPCDICNP